MTNVQEVKTGFTSGPTVYPAYPRQGIYETSVSQKLDIGARHVAKDGRVFRYAYNGAVALVTGHLIQSAKFAGAAATFQTDLSVQADSAIGDTSIFITTVTDVTTLNQYAGGYLCVTDDAGEGQIFGIIGNSAGAAGTIRIDLARPIQIAALITTSLITIMTNPYNKVIENAASTTSGLVIGVAMSAVPINYYSWLQTWGMACVKIKTAGLMGTAAIADIAAAGSVGVQTAGAGSLVQPEIGHFGMVVATTQSGFVFLTISP